MGYLNRQLATRELEIVPDHNTLFELHYACSTVIGERTGLKGCWIKEEKRLMPLWS
jgi:hypothetical protein